MDIVERLRGGTIGVWPDDDGPTEALMAEAADEIERLRKALKYEENRFNRISTHDPICYEYGPSHYECALREIERLREGIEWFNDTIEGHLLLDPENKITQEMKRKICFILSNGEE